MPVTSAEVLKAIEIFDDMGADEFFRHFEITRARSYFICHNGQEYDMKAVFRVARGQLGQAIPGPLDQSNIVAGWLRNLQFHIVHHPVTYARSSLEGRRYWDKQEKIERNSRLGREAKRLNAEQNGGWIECEACGFRDKDTSMLDAHHLVPLSSGPRKNCVKDFAVLCPTCHRWAHEKAGNRFYPLPVEEVRRERRPRKRKQPKPSSP